MLLTLEINDLEKGMFSKTMKLTDSKQESSERKAKERFSSVQVISKSVSR